MRTLPFLRDEDMVIFHVDIFPFSLVFPLLGESMLPSSASLRKQPFLGFFKVFPSHARTSISPTRISVLWRLIFMPMLSLCRRRGQGGFLRRFWLRRFTERSLSPAGVAPTLGYLLFLTVCPLEQNGGLLFLLLWYEGEGEAVREVGGQRDIRREWGRRESRRGESSWVFGILRKSVSEPGVDRWGSVTLFHFASVKYRSCVCVYISLILYIYR